MDRGCLPASAGPCIIIMVPGRPPGMTKRTRHRFAGALRLRRHTLTPVEASPWSLTTHNLEAPREEMSLAACSRQKAGESSRVSAPLRQSRAPPPSSPSPRKEMASITDIGHVHVLSPSGPRFRRVCRVVVIMEVVQLSSSCAPPTSNPHQCVCCVYFYHPDRCRGSCRIKRSAETTKQNPSEPWRD